MIVPVKKAQLFVFNNQKEKTLKLLQRHAFFMLTDNHHTNNVVDEKLEKVGKVIELLKPYTIKSFGPEFIEIDEKSFETINEKTLLSIDEVLALGDKLNENNEKLKAIRAKIELIEPYYDLDIPISQIRKINTVDATFGSIDLKQAPKFEEALNQFGSQFEVYEKGNKLRHYVVLNLKQKALLKEIKVSGLNQELKPKQDLLTKLEELNLKIQKFEDQKKQALQILNQLGKSSNTKNKVINESVIHEINVLSLEKSKLKDDIKSLYEAIKALEPFSSLDLTLQQVKTLKLVETKFGRMRLKSKNLEALMHNKDFEVTLFDATKTHQYLSISYLKDRRDELLNKIVEFESIEFDYKDLKVSDLITEKKALININEKRLVEIDDELKSFKPHVDDIAKLTSIHNVLKGYILQIIETVSQDEIFKAFKLKLIELLQLSYVKIFVEESKEDTLSIKVHLNQQDLFRVIVTDNRFEVAEIPNYVQKTALIMEGYSNEVHLLQIEISEIESNLNRIAETINDYKILYDQLSNDLDIKNVDYAQTAFTNYLEGWIIESKVEDLRKSLDEEEIIYELDLVEPAEDEVVPTALKNNRIVEPFESITNTFSPPSSKETDPNPSMSIWYWLIFGLMMGDIGYGLIMLIGCFAGLKILKPKGGLKSMMTVFGFSGLSTVIAGILYGSFFGYEVGILPKEYTLTLLDKPVEMLIFCMGLGILHIITGLVIKSINLLKDKDVLSFLGDALSWILVLIGIVVAIIPMALPLGDFASIVTNIGVILAIIGALLVVLFTAHAKKNVITRTLFGIIGLYNATSFLGDILSYSRILALALSGAVIASTMNMLAKMVMGIPYVGIIFALLVYLAGHLFNFVMNMLSAYVHAGRLQYLEFFGKFYDGGGTLFNPYQLKMKYIYSIKK